MGNKYKEKHQGRGRGSHFEIGDMDRERGGKGGSRFCVLWHFVYMYTYLHYASAILHKIIVGRMLDNASDGIRDQWNNCGHY